MGSAGQSSAFCPPAQPCRKLVVFVFFGEVRGAHLLSGVEARSSSPVEKKKKNSTARARGHKRANTKTKYKVDTQSMLFFGLRNDCAEDVHRADANRLGKKKAQKLMRKIKS